MEKTRQHWALLCLIIVASLFYLINLGERPLEDYDEATYASVLKSSFERSNFLSFEYFGANWFEKPPLYFWLAALNAKVFGFNEFALRLPSALSGITVILLTYLIVIELSGKDRPSAIFAGLILVLIPFFTAATRNMRMDTPVTACILAALYFYLVGFHKQKYLVGIGIAIGLGVLFKSIIGFLAMPIILIWSIATKNWSWIKNKFFWLGSLIGLALAAPWHIYESIKFGSKFWQDYLGYHVLGRFNENILGSKITAGYYLHSLWKLSQPILPLIFIGVILVLFSIKNRRYLAAALVSVFFIFILFSLSKTKLITYYTPLYPFVALASGFIYYELKNRARRPWFIHALAAVTVITFGYSGLSEFFYPQIYVTRAAADEKAIGLYLAENGNNQEINIFNWNHHNAVRYYSNQLTDSLQFNTGRAPKTPSWMILPTEVLALNEPLKNFPIPYTGEYLTLIHLINNEK